MTSINPTNPSPNNQAQVSSSRQREESPKVSIFYDKNNNGNVDEEDFKDSRILQFVKDNLLIGKTWSRTIKEKLTEYAKTLPQNETVQDNDAASENITKGTDGDKFVHTYRDKDGRIIKTEVYKDNSYGPYETLEKGIQYIYDENGRLTERISTDDNGEFLDYEKYDEQERVIYEKSTLYQWDVSYSEDGKTTIKTQKGLNGKELFYMKFVKNDDGSANHDESGFYSLNGEKIDMSDANSIMLEYLLENNLLFQ